MVVLPLFGDQHDNGQQIQNKGFGVMVDTFKCSESELLNAIESLLNNKELNEKLRNMSKRIQTDNSLAKLPQIVDDFLQNRDKYIQ